MNIKVIDEIDIREKSIFIRADLNISPVDDSVILEYKIDYILNTINHALENDSKLVIASHIDVPLYKYDSRYSLEHIAGRLSEKISKNIYFPDNCIGDAVKKIKNEMRNGEIMLLENLMFHNNEVNNSSAFAKKLADSIDVYVNESFSLIDYNYASNNAILSHIPEKCVGLSFNNDLRNLNMIKNCQGDDMAVYFGNDDIPIKLDFIDTYVDKIKLLILGGKFLYSFLHSMGYSINSKLINEQATYRLKKLFAAFKSRNKKILVPEDLYIELPNNKSRMYIDDMKRLKDDMVINGFGNRTLDIYNNVLQENNFIIWDGYFGTEINGDDYSPDSDKLSSTLVNNRGLVILLSEYEILEKKSKLIYSDNISEILCKNSAYKYLVGQEMESLIQLQCS